MPEATIASAVARTVSSFTLHANLFQLFQPIGGVSASPFGPLLTASCVVSARAGARSKFAASTNRTINFATRAIPLPRFGSALALALPSGDANSRGENHGSLARA